MARKKKSNSNALLISLIVGFLFITIAAVAGAVMLKGKEILPSDNHPSEQSSTVQQEESLNENEKTPAEDEVFESEIKGEDPAELKDEEPSAEETGNESEPVIPENIVYKRPDEMRAVHLAAGVDFLTGEQQDQEAVQKEIDQAVEQALSLKMNTLIVDAFYEDKALHNTKSMPSVAPFDILDMIVDAADANEMYVYAVYDLSKEADGITIADVDTVTTESINHATESLKEFVKKHNDLSGIMFKGYYNPPEENSYARYLENGGGIGYDNYMKGASQSLYAHAVKTVKTYAPNVQAGLLADVPWANTMENELGSATQAPFTALADGNADTKGFVENKLADFLVVQAFGSIADGTIPFSVVSKWWDEVAASGNIPLYIEHASDKVCTDAAGWTSEDQLLRQVGALQECTAVDGSIFNSLSALTANPKNSTTALLSFFDDNVSMDHILKDLVFTAPDAYNKTTFEKELVIKGASDPTFPLYMDGEEVERDSNGYFAIPVTLKPGDNVINFKHKDRDRTFHINRVVQIIKEVAPTGSMTVEGGMEITVTVVAYQDANVQASLGGRSIALSIDNTDEDEELRGTSYKRFKGTFTAPEATSSVQNLGQITVSASWEGLNDSKTGASVVVNKRVAVGDGVLVRVTAAQAETFPTNKLDDISSPSCYPLPKGTMDYAVGNEITYKEGSKTYNYYKLKSGLRVYSKDIAAVSKGELYENVIKGITVKADKRYTRVILNTSQNVPYKVNYTGDSIQFAFEYTKTVPENLKLNENPLFSSASWSGSTLTLKLLKSGAFLGYYGEYGSDGLELVFNNPTSLSGARIVVDPGHGVKDKGASGFNPNYPEAVIAWEIAQKLADALQDHGANVKLIRTRDVAIEPSMEERVSTAKAFAPHIYVSVHANSGGSSATGSEAYYFYPFAKNLSGYASSEMASALGSTNRGGKYGLYYVTRASSYVSVLCETGFVSNQSDYGKLIDNKYQKRIANGLVNAIGSFLKGAGSSNAGITGTQSTGNTVNAGDNHYDEEETQDKEVGIRLDESKITLYKGEKVDLYYTITPDDADQEIKWSSDDENVAKVNDRGRVSSVGEGTAVITATHVDSGETDTCKIIVKAKDDSEDEEEEEDGEVSVTGISLDEEELELTVEETAHLTEKISPKEAANTDVTWESSDEDVATVSKRGKVTAVGEGECAITVTTDDGGYTAKCIVRVTE